MNEVTLEELRCPECDELWTQQITTVHDADGDHVAHICHHQYACVRAYRLGANDVRNNVREVMQDDGR